MTPRRKPRAGARPKHTQRDVLTTTRSCSAARQDHRIVGVGQADLGHVHDVVAGFRQLLSDPDREVLVDQQPHPAVGRSMTRSRV